MKNSNSPYSILKSISIVLLSVLITVSCGKSEPEATEQTPTPTPKPVDKIELAAGTNLNPTLPTEGGAITISFNSSTAWSAQAVNDRADGWCSVNPTSGNAGAC